MRIISGMARGRKLSTLKGNHTRPTSEKVKEALFSIIQFEIEGRRVLDLFAGTGQLGLEALSRGAKEAVFVENDRQAMEIVRENIRRCGFEESARVMLSDYSTAIKRPGETYDIILADPPYHDGIYLNILAAISEFDILDKSGILIFESDAKEKFPAEFGNLVCIKEYFYGSTRLTTYRKRGDPA